ncbi:MAG: glycosyltransferase family 2 protein [Polyangiaceae bacterium]|nr:glycosyltransferase family 2 protein [Polyangiaceae bacterium]
MKLSVVVPLWNEADRVPQLVHGLRAVGFDELICVDGGSTDRTWEALGKQHGVTRIRASKGRGGQLNAGASLATGDALWFVHADATPPAAARTHIEKALRNPRVVAGAFQTWHVGDPPGNPWTAWTHLADLRSRISRHPYGDQGLFVRTQVFRELGGFANIPLMEDYELSRRLAKVAPTARIRERMTVSDRRFRGAPLASLLTMWTFPALFRLGIPPHRLSKLYKDLR